jgi:hypothetical protein
MANSEIIGAGQDKAHRAPKKILYLTLHKKWFDAIAAGTKKEEYRLQSEYWKTRLKGKIYEEIHFRNGYRKDSRQMRVKVIDITNGMWNGEQCFIIRLGAVKQIRNDSIEPTRDIKT